MNSSAETSIYVDVHTHLTHPQFDLDRLEVISRCQQAGLGAIVVNGTDPVSNRQVLDLSVKHPIVKAALGIYPIEAVNHLLPSDFHLSITPFSVDQEIAFIKEQAQQKTIIAIGECGLDAYHVGEDTFAEQERVFLALLQIAYDYDIPVIVHSRKREQRTIEIMEHHGQKRVNMHCFGGKTKLAITTAEKYGWCYSIPSNLARSSSFQSMVKSLPDECMLTETDSPYLALQPQTRCEPAHVVHTVTTMAQLKNRSIEDMKSTIWQNYLRLFFS